MAVNPTNVVNTIDNQVGHLVAHAYTGGGNPIPHLVSVVDSYGGIAREVVSSYAGEVATDRMARLCAEAGISLVMTTPAAGDGAVIRMGPQAPGATLDLLRECADADGGFLFEARDSLALVYRPRVSLYSQTPVAIPYGYLSPPVDPVDDDTNVRNDVTVTRTGGASARAVQTTGPLPVQSVGVYDENVTLNVATDAQLPDIAGWRLHLDTVDESRYPRIGVNFASTHWPGNTALTSQATAMAGRDTVEVSGLPTWLPSGTARLMVLDYNEPLDAYDRDLTWNAVPGSPWDVATVDGSQRVAADGSTLAAGITSSATSLQITFTAANGPWTTNAANFPLDINCGGERITLSAISGTTSPQTATVSARAVNGISKAHVAGESVDVWLPATVAL